MREYEVEEKVEDERISNYVFNRCFKMYHYLKDDLIEEGLVALWKAREDFDETKSTYITYATEVAKNAMRMFLRKEFRHLDNENIDDLKVDIEDEKINIDNSIHCRDIIQQVLDNLKSDKEIISRIIDLLELGFSRFEISGLLNMTHQTISNKLKKFKQMFNDLNI